MARFLSSIIVLSLACGGHSGATAGTTPSTSAEGLPAELDRIRAVATSPVSESSGAELDEAWRAIEAMGDGAIPGLREALAGAADEPDFFVVDVAHLLLLRSQTEADMDAIFAALATVDYDDPVVHAGWNDLFRMFHTIAVGGDERILAEIDRGFLTANETVAFPVHAMFDVSIEFQLMWLYGAFGTVGETHVASLLRSPPEGADLATLIGLLAWIGTERSVPAVERVAASSRDGEVVTTAVGFCLTMGGPPGLAAARRLAGNLPGGEGEELAGFADRVETVARRPAEPATPLSADEARAQLEQIVANRSHADIEDPGPLLASELDDDALIEGLVRGRAAILGRLSDEAIEEVEVMNIVLQRAQFRHFADAAG